MSDSLSHAFEQKYEGGRAGLYNPDERPSDLEAVSGLRPRLQKIWLFEDVLGVETGIWSKSRARLNNEDLEVLLDGLFDELDVSPAVLEVRNE